MVHHQNDAQRPSIEGPRINMWARAGRSITCCSRSAVAVAYPPTLLWLLWFVSLLFSAPRCPSRPPPPRDVPGGGSIRAVSRVRSLPHQRRNNQSPDSSGTRLIVPPVFGPSVRPRLHLRLTVFGHLPAGLSLDLSTPAVASMWRPLFAHRIHLGPTTVFGQTTPDESPGSLGTTIEPSIT